ncbi:MAG: dicarboxylate/amino acid:cation symporter [Selenomonadaceae bacterium]|nr:dicarboxylate/amino acid:cation symporter [Selenomonadaceae bacterium]
MQKNFFMDAENFSDAQEAIEHQLKQLDVKIEDILRAQLLVEEIFWRMIKQGRAAKVEVQVVKQYLGKIQIQMTAEGTPYNPLIEVADWSEDDEDYYTAIILKGNRHRLNWLRKNNLNAVTIDVSGENNRQLWLLIAAIVSGLICGVVMKEILLPETIALINDNAIMPIQTMFMNALSMIIAPVVFFSIISGIIGMGASASIGKIGSKLIGLYLFSTVIAAIVGLGIAQIIFSGEVSKIGTIPAAMNKNVESYHFSLIQFIVDIIPENLISPVAEGNLLQIIFIAVLFGTCLNSLGDKVKLLKDFVDNCNEFFMKVVDWIIFFVPPIAFFAMISLVVDMGVDTVLEMGKLIFGELVGCAVMLGVYMLMIKFFGKISPASFLKKIPAFWSMPFATSSSGVSMPLTMNLCTKRLGISPKITSFSIPVGTTVNMNGACIYFPLAAIMFLKMYGVEINLNALIIIFTMTVSLSVGTPAVPNAAVICILSIVATFGVPSEIAGLLFCIGTVCERIVTCLNVTGDVAATTALARTENLFDEKIYFS